MSTHKTVIEFPEGLHDLRWPIKVVGSGITIKGNLTKVLTDGGPFLDLTEAEGVTVTGFHFLGIMGPLCIERGKTYDHPDDIRTEEP